MAAPEAASTARAIRDFFIASYSKVKHRAPVRGVLGAKHLRSPAGSPGQPPGGEVASIAPEPAGFRKGIHPQSAGTEKIVAVVQHPPESSIRSISLQRRICAA